MRRHQWGILAGVGLLLGLAGAAIGPAGAAEPEIRKLALGFGIDLPFAPHIVAITKGWFKEAGFTEVTTKTFTAGALAGEALVAGEIQLWTPGNLPPISMFHNGIPIVILGTNCVNWGLDKLVVRKDANVNTPQDLYRIKIGLLQGSTASADLHQLARHYGLDEGRLQVVNLPPPEQLAGLVSGNIQALLSWEPWPYRALQGVDARVVHTGLISYFAGNQGERVKISDNRSVWVASQEFARKNPRAVRAIMQVLLRAQKYVADPQNKEEVLRLFSEFQKQDLATNRALWDNYVFNPVFDEAYVADMERTTAFLETSGRIKKRTPILDYTYTDPVGEVDASLVKVRGRWKP
ncbi:MAG TPA: NrtA/SsuA/CpmA family ABC transporter substrate-binding protein [Methylomirabilota bacterium]|jgi:ABC-type nitrate/sulfonate/bicarbonate transport system substrate-binding protein|nr:NrtA/SsuA/CpmA family ABC transporter substrate-binding protein [Methylomirabilota bacterium]HEV8672712.1 NrtA/SsuA/CpmA family ABC transporter substrate-binding protein [Methylomirabilota bacterium]